MTASVNQGERILPLPYLPTYIARRPKQLNIVDSNENIESFNPIFASNWQKASDNYAKKHRNVYGSPYIEVDLDSVLTLPKEYDTYKTWYHPQYDLHSHDIFNQTRPFTVPNHTTQTSEKWSRFLDQYPDRFQINYPLPNDETVVYHPNRRLGRYPYNFNQDTSNVYAGLPNPIHPVSNPFRNYQTKQKSMVAHPIWLPYGTTPRRDQKPKQK